MSNELPVCLVCKQTKTDEPDQICRGCQTNSVDVCIACNHVIADIEFHEVKSVFYPLKIMKLHNHCVDTYENNPKKYQDKFKALDFDFVLKLDEKKKV